MDFSNEFADLAVGDAWSPKYEGKRVGIQLSSLELKNGKNNSRYDSEKYFKFNT